MRVNKILSQISFKNSEIPDDLKGEKEPLMHTIIPTQEAEILLGKKNKINYFA